MTIEQTKRSPQSFSGNKLLGIVVIVLITIISFWLALNPAWVRWLGEWGYVGAFLISMVASATVVLPAPGIAVVIAMGVALNPIWLGIASGVGSAFGELTGYVAGVTGNALVPEKQRHYFDRLHRLTDRYGAWLLFALSAIPFPLFDLAGIIAGMMRMRIASFLLAVSAGKIIKYIVLILIGSSSVLYLFDWFQNMVVR
ncbi:MAG: VTT domain-containing protein [Chloroflexota bacterium]